jgi:hypothetical protein
VDNFMLFIANEYGHFKADFIYGGMVRGEGEKGGRLKRSIGKYRILFHLHYFTLSKASVAIDSLQ